MAAAEEAEPELDVDVTMTLRGHYGVSFSLFDEVYHRI